MLRTLAFFSLVTSASASRLFPDHFARTFDFPDSKKDRLPETFVPGPLSELHLAKHQVVRSQAAGKVIVSGFAQPRLLPDVAKLKKLVSIPRDPEAGTQAIAGVDRYSAVDGLFRRKLPRRYSRFSSRHARRRDYFSLGHANVVMDTKYDFGRDHERFLALHLCQN
jgi:hypothetical protein